jgi:hypothetical protein
VCVAGNRDAGGDVAVSSDVATLKANSATPSANLCATTARPWTGAPHSWYSANCPAKKRGRYVWWRNNALPNVLCPVPVPADWTTGCTVPGENYVQFSEISVYSSRCATLRNVVNTATVALTDGLYSGCGAAGALRSTVAWSGSTCTQACAAGTKRIRGGSAAAATTTLQCNVGEWQDTTSGIAIGPMVCDTPCPALSAPAGTDTTLCKHTVASLDFASGTGKITDWYPAYRVYKVASSGVVALPAMEYRSIMDAGVLTLSGSRTLWALNEPLWASASQGTSAFYQSVSVDVKAGSAASVMGVALKVSAAAEPSTFYLLKLQVGSSGHQFIRVNAGVETVLGGATAGVCTVSTTAAVRVVFKASGTSLSATCGGVSLGSATDGNAGGPLAVGSAGLYSDNPSLALSGTGVFDNLLVERSCDAGGACPEALAGEVCTMTCSTTGAVTPVTCQAGGSWSASVPMCITPTGECDCCVRDLGCAKAD